MVQKFLAHRAEQHGKWVGQRSRSLLVTRSLLAQGTSWDDTLDVVLSACELFGNDSSHLAKEIQQLLKQDNALVGTKLPEENIEYLLNSEFQLVWLRGFRQGWKIVSDGMIKILLAKGISVEQVVEVLRLEGITSDADLRVYIDDIKQLVDLERRVKELSDKLATDLHPFVQDESKKYIQSELAKAGVDDKLGLGRREGLALGLKAYKKSIMRALASNQSFMTIVDMVVEDLDVPEEEALQLVKEVQASLAQ